MTRLVVQTTPEQEIAINDFCKDQSMERSMLAREAIARYILSSGYVFPFNNPPRMADVNHEAHVEKLKEKLEGKQRKLTP